MAWIIIGKPGSKNGPCKKCRHLDCAGSHAMAARICRYCDKPIGYDRQVTADEGRPVHFACALKAAEIETKKEGVEKVKRLLSRVFLLAGFLALVVAPAAAQVANDAPTTRLSAEVNECRGAPSYVCVEVWVYFDSSNPDGGVHLSYLVRDLNYAVYYVPETNLYTIPRSMFTVDPQGRVAHVNVPAGTVVVDFEGEPFTVPGDIVITWEADGRDRTIIDLLVRHFVGDQVTRTKRTATIRPAIGLGTLLGWPVNSRNGWPDCCRDPGRISVEIETAR